MKTNPRWFNTCSCTRTCIHTLPSRITITLNRNHIMNRPEYVKQVLYDEEEVWKMCVNSETAWRLQEKKKFNFNILKMFNLIEQIHSMNHQPKDQVHSARHMEKAIGHWLWTICIQCANVKHFTQYANRMI